MDAACADEGANIGFCLKDVTPDRVLDIAYCLYILISATGEEKVSYTYRLAERGDRGWGGVLWERGETLR